MDNLLKLIIVPFYGVYILFIFGMEILNLNKERFSGESRVGLGVFQSHPTNWQIYTLLQAENICWLTYIEIFLSKAILISPPTVHLFFATEAIDGKHFP